MRLITLYSFLSLVCSRDVSDARNCTVITNCFLQIFGSCDGYGNDTVIHVPDLCHIMDKPLCRPIYLFACQFNRGNFSWCYRCADHHSDCFSRWMELCTIEGFIENKFVEADGSVLQRSACISCSEMNYCCRIKGQDHDGSMRLGTMSTATTIMTNAASEASRQTSTLDSLSDFTKTIRNSSHISTRPATVSGRSHIFFTYVTDHTTSATDGYASSGTAAMPFSSLATSHNDDNKMATLTTVSSARVLPEMSAQISSSTSTVLHANHNHFTQTTGNNSASRAVVYFLSTIGSSSSVVGYDTNTKTSTVTTSKNATNSAPYVPANGVTNASLLADDKTRQLCDSPNCSDSNCNFKGHCYIVKKLDSYVEGWGGARAASEVCDIIRPGALGLAVRSQEEIDYLSRLLEYQGVNGSVLTSGLRSCCDCNSSGSWYHWQTEVDGDLIEVTTSGDCVVPSYYVINGGNSTAGELAWTLASPAEDAPPTYVICQAPSRSAGGSSTTAAPGSSSSWPRPPPPSRRPPPPPPPRSPPPPPRPGSGGRCRGVCKQTDMYGHPWTSPCGMYQKRRCPTGNPGYAWWYCSHDARFWGLQPYYGECHHTWIDEAKYLVTQQASAEEIVQMVQELAVNHSFFGHEIGDLLDVLGATVALHAVQTSGITAPGDRLNSSTAFTAGVAAALGNVLDSDTSWLQLDAPERALLGTQLLNLSGDVGLSLAATASLLDANGSYRASYRSSDLHMEVQVSSWGLPVRFPSTAAGAEGYHHLDGGGDDDADDGDRERETHILVSGDGETQHVGRLCSVGVVIQGTPTHLIFPPYLNSPCANDTRAQMINSPVVSFELGAAGRPTSEHQHQQPGFRPSVRLTFRHVVEARGPEEITIRRKLFDGEVPSVVRGSAKCVYWNYSLGDNGLWDEWGCRVVSSTDTHTICACDHLSTFAVLMDVHDYVGKDPTLQVLQLTCSAASVICLLLTLVVFYGCRSIQSERTSIGKNLCMCLLVAHILTLSMLDRTFFNLSDSLCSVAAAFLHYFFLASFCWMWVEGHYLYRLVVRVFDSGRDLWRAYVLFGFGFPALVVSLTEVAAQLSGDTAYGRDELCWLTTPIYVWAFMGPVLILTVLNSIVVVMAMRAAVSAGMGQGKSKLRKVGVWLKGWFSLSSLLGITWLFGVGFMEYYASFEYVFVILNGCQGVFIFLFRCLLNTQVRKSVLNEAKQRASVKRFNKRSVQRSSWYISSRSATSGRPSSLSNIREESATPTAGDNPAEDLPPRYEDAVWTTSAGKESRRQSWPSRATAGANHDAPHKFKET